MITEEEILLKRIYENFETEKIFVLDKETEYSYKELYQYITYYNELYEHKNIVRVLISIPQGFDAYSAVVGAFIAGVTFCTVKHDDPVERKKYYHEVFKPDIIITNSTDMYADVYTDKILLVDKDVIPVGNLGCTYTARQQCAYVMFTSGTTGLPKGVCIKRSALCKSILWMLEKFKLNSDDICSQYSNMSFDMSLIDIFLALAAGAKLIPFPTLVEKLFPEKLIYKYKISFWHSVPTVIDIMQSRGALTNFYLSTIQKCKIGGDRVYVNQMQLLFRELPNLQAFITYGTTEITFICTCIELNKENYLEYGKNNIAIGYPIDGWKVELQNVENEVGHITVSGDNIGLGYLEGNENKFFDRHGEWTFFTGDYGQYIDGCLYYCGRKDQQIKINGNRINLSEIDIYVRNIEGCTSSLTILMENKIVLFFTGDILTIEVVNEYLKKRLSRVSIPHKIIKLKEMPYNNSGKINRKKLVEIYDLSKGNTDDRVQNI